MLVATATFVEGLELWLRAVRANDFAAAREHAQRLTMHGELLAIHPDFVRPFKQLADGADPGEVLLRISQFLMCASDARARALNQPVYSGGFYATFGGASAGQGGGNGQQPPPPLPQPMPQPSESGRKPSPASTPSRR